MMSNGRKLPAMVLLAAFAVLLPSVAHAQYTLSIPQASELWGGPAAKGTGASGSHFDTTITVNAILASAAGNVDYWAGGALKASVPFSLTPRGVASIPTPAALDGAGAFLYHITSSAAVMAFSETYNDTPNGRFGVSVSAFTTADFLNAGDEASGGGAEDSSDPTRSRTNVGLLCSPTSALSCNLEVSAYGGGALLGTGTISAGRGSAAQASLSSLVAGASGRSGISLRLRVLQGLTQPYAIRNDNGTSDGTLLPLAVARAAFSTAPTINSFTVSPDSGCAPLTVTLTWTTTGAAKVNVSGIAGDLPANGSTTIVLLTSTDLVLTATAQTGATTSLPRHVTITPGASAPTPSPASGQVGEGGQINGLLPPAPAGSVTFVFVQHQSTGSTFSLSGNGFTYTAGSTPGTDIIRLSAASPCGPMTADFTATVLPPGTPVIFSFTADPAVGCAPQDVVLSWSTQDAISVEITGIIGQLSPVGSIGITISTTTTFFLTAHGANGETSTMSLLVPVDTSLPVPVLCATLDSTIPPTPPCSGSSASVSRGGIVYVYQTNTDIPNNALLRIVADQNHSGSTMRYDLDTNRFIYYAGLIPNTTDVYRIYNHNGCGFIYATFTVFVQP